MGLFEVLEGLVLGHDIYTLRGTRPRRIRYLLCRFSYDLNLVAFLKFKFAIIVKNPFVYEFLVTHIFVSHILVFALNSHFQDFQN